MRAAQPPAQRCPLTSRPLHTAPPLPDGRTPTLLPLAAAPRLGRPAEPPRFCQPPWRGPGPIVALTPHSARPGPRHPAGPAQAPPHSPPAQPPPEPPPPPPRPPAAAPPAAAAAAPPRAGARRGSGAGPGGSAGRSCSPRARRRERAGGPEGEGREGWGGRCSASFSSPSSSCGRSADRFAVGHVSAARKLTVASEAPGSVTEFVEPYWLLWWGRTTPLW